MKASARLATIARSRRGFDHFKAKLAVMLQNECGVSAIEFSIFAPMLAVSLLTVVDIGLAVRQRMTMDHVLRTGIQSAMADPGIENVLKILQISAAENFTVGGSAPSRGKPPMTLAVNRYCVCPSDPTPRPCSTICTGTIPTLAYYSLSASSTYPAMFIPSIVFKPEVKVQVR